MRIGLISPGFSCPNNEWALPALRDLATGLAERHDVRVYAIDYPSPAASYSVAGVPVHAIGSHSIPYLGAVAKLRRLVRAVGDDHRLRSFDLLHGFWPDHSGPATLLLSRRLGLPSMLTVMAGELTYEPAVAYGNARRLRGAIGAWCARHATALTTLSDDLANRLRNERRGIDIKSLPFGVDTGRFSPTGPAADMPDAFNILMVGSLVPVKGHDIALQALERVLSRHQRVHLHIVGIGPLSGELGRRASRGRLAGHVSLHGAIPHTRMGAYYRAADLCLLSSHFESSGMVIMEAAACGKLTVGASVGSMPEITPSAYRVSPGDATALAAVIERCVDSPDDVDTIGRQVAARVAERYSVESMIDRYSAAYERLSQ